MNYDSPEQKARDLERKLAHQKMQMMHELFSALFDDSVSEDDMGDILDNIIERNGREDMARELFEARLLTKCDESFVEVVMAYAMKAQKDERPTKKHLFQTFITAITDGSFGKDEISAFMAENPVE